MLKGIYSAAAGMTSQMILTDITADNLANISTPGFKQTTVQFKTFGDVLMNRLGNNESQELGQFAQGAQVLQSVTNFTQGDMIQTGNPLDMALHGDGFFVVKVQPNDSILYTRAGSFTRDNEGYIATSDGGRLQGQSGDIEIPRDAKQINVTKDGDVVVDGQTIEHIKVVQFSNPQELVRTSSNYYKTFGQPSGDAKDTIIENGAIERSNANVITEMVNSMTGLRIYETLQKSIQMQNETLGKSVNDVGRV